MSTIYNVTSDHQLCKFRINLDLTLSFSFLWVYGFYASISFTSNQANNVASILLCIIMIGLVEISTRQKNNYISISIRDAFLCLIYCSIALIFGYREITDSIVNDHFYHLQLAMSHAQRILMPDLIKDRSLLADAIQHVEYKYVLWAINCFIISALFTFFYLCCVLPKRRSLRCILTACLFLSLRWISAHYVTQGDIHPPLRLLPLNISTVFLGINNFALRSPGLIAIALFICHLASRLRPTLGSMISILAALSFGTAPLLWHVGTIVEASIWSTLTFSVLLVELIVHPQRPLDAEEYSASRTESLRVLYALVGLASLMRQSAFIAILPLFVAHFFWLCKKKSTRFDKTPRSHRRASHAILLMQQALATAYPIVIMLPWTLFIAYTGTPATDRSDLSIYAKLVQAFGDASAFKYLYFHLGMIWFGVMLIGLLSHTTRGLLTIFQFLIATLLFYSVTPHIWGLARYQAEIGIPIACIGLISFLTLVATASQNKSYKIQKYAVAALLCIITGANVMKFREIHNVLDPVDNDSFFYRSRNGTINGLAEMPFAFDTALIAIKAKGFSEDLYIDGTVYGPFPHILAGYDFAEVRRNMDLGPVWTGVDPYALNAVARIRSALFADWGEFKTQNSIRVLTKLGWELNEKFPHPATKSNVLYFITRH